LPLRGAAVAGRVDGRAAQPYHPRTMTGTAAHTIHAIVSPCHIIVIAT
jgi:hypothetical protein